MFTQFTQLANQAISPVAARSRPQDSFLSPSERMRADIMQAELEQQGRLSSAILAASPDPAASNLFGGELAGQITAAGIASGSGVNQGAGLQALGAGVTQVGRRASNAKCDSLERAGTSPTQSKLEACDVAL